MHQLLLLLCWVCGSVKIAVIISSFTSSDYHSIGSTLMKSSTAEVQIEKILITESSSLNDFQDFFLLIDFASSAIFASRLRRISSEMRIPLLCISSCVENESSLALNVFYKCEDIFSMIRRSLEVLGWTSFAVFYDNFQCSEEISLMLKPKVQYFVSNDMEDLIDIVISRHLKTFGVKQWVLVTEYLTAQVIVNKLKENNLIKAGNGILAGPFSYFGLTETGIIEVSSEKYKDLSNFNNFLAAYILDLLETLKDSESQFEVFSLLLKARRETFKPGLFNIQNSSKVKIFDFFCEDCGLLEEVLYLGGTQVAPLDSLTQIPMSVTAGITDPNNTSQISNQNMMNGVYVAIDLYNNQSGVLENFRFSSKNIPCYMSGFFFNSSCYSEHLNDLGLFHMSAHSEVYSILLYSFTSGLNMNLFGTSDGIIMADKNAFPLYISTGVPHKYEVAALVRVIKMLGFDKFAVLSCNNSMYTEWIDYAVSDAYNNHMEIMNDLKDYIVNVSATGELVASDSVVQKIVDSRARIVFVACPALAFNHVMSKFSDLGLKQGDVYFTSISLTFPVLSNQSDPTFAKRKPFIAGTFSLVSGFFLGDTGKYVENQLRSKYVSYNRRSCDYFDSFSLGYYGIKSLIIQGKDYEKSSLILSEARKARFVGCNGSIKNVDYTNLRESELYVVSQVVFNGTSFIYQPIANYYPSGSTVFQLLKDPNWQSSQTPSTVRINSWDCPFDPKLLKTFEGGQVVVGVVCGIVAAFTIFNTLVIWKKFWSKEVEDLANKEEISFQDSVAMITVLLELIQTASMGPDLGKLLNVFKSVASALTYSVDDFISVQNGVFWYILTSIFVVVVFWVLLCFVWFFKLHSRCSDFWLFRFFGWSIINLMPIIGNLMFIPIISTLINVFVCDQSLDGSFKESVLDKDCYQKCWKSRHLPLSVVSGVFILLYQPLAVYFRPLWQETLPLLHIRALPRYLMMKSVFQVVLIMLNKTLKRKNKELHSVIFLVLMFLYTVFITLRNSYNYPRLRLWHRLGSFGVVFLTLVCIFHEFVYDSQKVWVSVLVIGWVFVVVFGIRVQSKKYPSLLYRPASKDIEKIFRWMFNLERSDSIFKSGKYQVNDGHVSKEVNSLDQMIFSS